MRWRRVRTLVVREVRATFRDPFTVTILVAVPILALLLFGFILTTEVRHLPLGVHDAARTAASRRLVADLAAQGTFDPRPFATRAALERAIATGTVTAAIVIPPDFDRGLEASRHGGAPPEVEVVYDAAETVLAGNAEGYVRAIVSASAASLAAEPGAARGPGVAVATRTLFNPTLDGVAFMVSGVFGFVLSFLTVLITAVSIVGERTTGTFEQLQVTPATSLEILLGKLLPLGAVFALDVLLMALIAGFVVGVWPHGSLLFFLAVSSAYVLISLAIGLLISATSRSAAEAVQRSVIFAIPLVQLSGFILPVRNMPEWLQWLTALFPATHYITLSRAVYLRGEGPATLWPQLLFIFASGVLLIVLAARKIEARA
ncbi:MAG: ABC transporter permease [Candidatus Binatia bacterium]